MKFKINNKYFKIGLTAFLVIIASILFYYIIFFRNDLVINISKITNILMPLILGLAIAYLLSPILNFIENSILNPLFNKMKIKDTSKRKTCIRVLGIILTVVFIIFILYALISMMISQIVPSISNIVSNFDTYISNFTKWLNKFLSDYPDVKKFVLNTVDNYSEEIEGWLNEFVLPQTSGLIKFVSMGVLGFVKALWNFVIGLVIAVYFLASKEKFVGQAKKVVYAIFSKDKANIILNNFSFTHKTFIGFISGKVLDSIIIGLLCFIGTTLMGTPYAALVSVIVGVTNVIPVFGPYLGAIPSIILIFIVNPTVPLNCVYFAIFVFILQQIDGNIIGPMILGDSTGLSGFWVIVSITLFGGLFGILGMFIGVPIFAVIYAAIRSFVNAALLSKNMSLESDKYINTNSVDEDGVFLDNEKVGKSFMCSMEYKYEKKKNHIQKNGESNDNWESGEKNNKINIYKDKKTGIPVHHGEKDDMDLYDESDEN